MNRRFDFWSWLLFNTDGGGGGGDGGGAGGAGGTGDAGGAPGGDAGGLAGVAKLAGDAGGDKSGGDPAKPGDPPAPAKPYKPEKFDDRYAGADDRETIDKLWGEIAGRPKAPESPDKYELKLDDKLAQRFGDLSKDPALAVARKAMHAAGLTNDQFNTAFSQLYQGMSEAGLLDEPVSSEKFVEALAPDNMSPADRKLHAGQRAKAVLDQVNTLVSQNVLSREEANLLQAVGDVPSGVLALEKVFKAMNPTGIVSGGARSGAPTRETLKAEMRDPRYDSQSPKYDPAFRSRVDAEWQRTYGGQV